MALSEKAPSPEETSAPETSTLVDTWSLPDITVAAADIHVRYNVASGDAAAKLGRRERLVRRAFARPPRVTVRAVSGVNLVARAGESVGLVGLNGSGKSTLLRIIAGLEKPMRGMVWARSTPTLLGVNAALIPELTGAQNVRLGCLAMGMTPQEATEALPEVVALADIGPSVHLPMSTYSSGMSARLRFSIAVAARPDILLIDEALATGDASFKDRSKAKMDEMRSTAGTVFLVSHAAQTVEEECTRAIWLHKGKVVMDGEAEYVARKYRWFGWKLAKGENDKAAEALEEGFREGEETSVHLVQPPPQAAPARHAAARGRGSAAYPRTGGSGATDHVDTGRFEDILGGGR